MKILFQGDSITDCYRAYNESPDFFVRLCSKIKKRSALGEGYASVAAQMLGENHSCVNRGISGNKITDVYERRNRDIFDIRPDCMSLLIGVNDIWHGLDKNNGTSPETFEKTYDALIREIKEKLPETKIMLMEPFVLEASATQARPDAPDRYDVFRMGVTQLAQIVRQLALRHNLTFISLQQKLDEAAELTEPSLILSDGVHPTDKGHRIIAEEWIKAFENIK